ncbi:GtrA family protein [Sphingomonas sp. FW199]
MVERAVMIQRINELRRHPVMGQLVRFGIAGGISSLIYVAVYVPLTETVFPGARAVLAVPFAFAFAVTAGFFLHSRWSFKDHGVRTSGGGQPVKFVMVQGAGLLLHLLLTWGMVGQAGLPEWSPLVPGLTLVPLLTFWINRQWVFGE